MCKFHCGVSKGTLWITWLICTVIAAAYVALSLRTFAKVNEAYSDTEDGDNKTVAVLVASFSGAVVVIAFTVLSFFLLLGKQMTTSGVGYTYGFINASALNLALFSLLCSLVLYAFEDDISVGFSKDRKEGDYEWTDTDTDVFKSTYAFGFISAGMYFGLFLVMFLASFTIERQNTLMEQDRGAE